MKKAAQVAKTQHENETVSPVWVEPNLSFGLAESLKAIKLGLNFAEAFCLSVIRKSIPGMAGRSFFAEDERSI